MSYAETQLPREERWTARALVAGSGVLVAFALAPVGVGLASAAVLYAVCARPYAWATRRMSSHLAASLCAVGVLLIVILPLVWLGTHMASRLPAVLTTVTTLHLPESGRAAQILAWISVRLSQLRSSIASWLPGKLVTTGGGVAWSLVNWSIALFGLYYLLSSAPDLWLRVAKAFPFSAHGAETLRLRFHDVTQAIVGGTLLSAAAEGAAIGVGFRIANVSDPLFWGMCAAVVTLLPILGNKLVWLPAVVLLLLQQHIAGAAVIALAGVVVAPIVGRLVRTRVGRRVGQVHPMITLVGAIAGARLAGLPGIMIGPVALAMFVELVDVYGEENGRSGVAQL